MAQKIYTVTLETYNPFKQFQRYVAADTIKEAWERANTKGAEYNARVRKNKCVVYGVAFRGDYQES